MKKARQYKTVRYHLNQPMPKPPRGKLLGWTLADDRESIDLHILAYKRVQIRRLDKPNEGKP